MRLAQQAEGGLQQLPVAVRVPREAAAVAYPAQLRRAQLQRQDARAHAHAPQPRAHALAQAHHHRHGVLQRAHIPRRSRAVAHALGRGILPLAQHRGVIQAVGICVQQLSHLAQAELQHPLLRAGKVAYRVYAQRRQPHPR